MSMRAASLLCTLPAPYRTGCTSDSYFVSLSRMHSPTSAAHVVGFRTAGIFANLTTTGMRVRRGPAVCRSTEFVLLSSSEPLLTYIHCVRIDAPNTVQHIDLKPSSRGLQRMDPLSVESQVRASHGREPKHHLGFDAGDGGPVSFPFPNVARKFHCHDPLHSTGTVDSARWSP